MRTDTLRRWRLVGLLLAVVVVLTQEPVFAESLPWEDPLTELRDSLTGPVAIVIVLIAMLVAGATLIFARVDFSEFAQRMIYIVLVFTVIALSAQLLENMFDLETPLVVDDDTTSTTTPSGALLPGS